MNNRKNKVIPAYELTVTLGWTGSVDGEEAKGKVRAGGLSPLRSPH